MTNLILCNEKAGTFESCCADLGSIATLLEENTGESSITVDVHTVTEEHLKDAHRVIVMGGDGTVGRILGLVANHSPRIPVGIIPAGTGNLLAKCLGLLPENPEMRFRHAYETIHTGRTISMDLGTANGTPFALDVGIGPLAMAVTEPDKQEKNAHGLLSYVRPLLKSMFQRPYRFRLNIDSKLYECEASAIFVTNPQELGIGQAANVSSLRDGKFDLIILNPTNLDEYVGLATRFGSWFLGNAETDTMPYRIIDVSEVTIEAIEELPAPPLLMNSALAKLSPGTDSEVGLLEQPSTMLDGDVFGKAPVAVRVLPQAVDVYVPLTTVA